MLYPPMRKARAKGAGRYAISEMSYQHLSQYFDRAILILILGGCESLKFPWMIEATTSRSELACLSASASTVPNSTSERGAPLSPTPRSPLGLAKPPRVL